MFYVNLPLRYVHKDITYLHRFIDLGLNPEFTMDFFVLDRLDEYWHRNVINAIVKAGLKCSVHLPFMELRPSCEDPYIREASYKRLKKAFEIARIYQPRHMVGHASFSNPVYPTSEQEQLSNSVDMWGTLMRSWPGHPPLFLENTHDRHPRRLAELLEALSSYNCGMCFDIGHWHSFSKGYKNMDLEHWVEVFSPYIRHVHMHDNLGDHDRHLGLGHGCIPVTRFLELLEMNGVRPTVTLEPHTDEALQQSLAHIREHAELYERVLGISLGE